MSELISRQDAIDAVMKYGKQIPTFAIAVKDALENLPSAQPETNCSEFPNNSDTISRQAAIKAMKCINDSICEQQAVDALCDLPTAEKVGKWIIHSEVKNIYGGTYIECSECREKYVVQYIEDEKFCRNCGARMRGEKDG